MLENKKPFLYGGVRLGAINGPELVKRVDTFLPEKLIFILIGADG